MNEELFNEATKSNVLSKKLIDQLQESMSYSSISFINNAVDSLKIIRKRLERGDCIILEETGEKLTLASYETFLNDRFSSYICSEVYAPEGRHGKEKVYFKLEACPEGYTLLMAEDGKANTYEWISSLSERFSLVYMIATGIVYIKNIRTGSYSPFISQNGKYCRYDKELGKLIEVS